MSTESLIHGDYPDEPLPAAVARRLRGQLAEHRMTLEDLGKVLGLSKMAASRRVNGETPISLAELELIEAHTPITAAYLLTGQHPAPSPQPPPPGQSFRPPHPAERVRQLRPVADVAEDRQPELVNAEERWSWYAEALADERTDSKPIKKRAHRPSKPVGWTYSTDCAAQIAA
jgi:transcriptional regulator with XRE-family HTH domain